MDPPVGTYERSYHTWANAEGKFTVLLDPVPVGSPTVAPHTVRVRVLVVGVGFEGSGVGVGSAFFLIGGWGGVGTP